MREVKLYYRVDYDDEEKSWTVHNRCGDSTCYDVGTCELAHLVKDALNVLVDFGIGVQ